MKLNVGHEDLGFYQLEGTGVTIIEKKVNVKNPLIFQSLEESKGKEKKNVEWKGKKVDINLWLGFPKGARGQTILDKREGSVNNLSLPTEEGSGWERGQTGHGRGDSCHWQS